MDSDEKGSMDQIKWNVKNRRDYFNFLFKQDRDVSDVLSVNIEYCVYVLFV